MASEFSVKLHKFVGWREHRFSFVEDEIRIEDLVYHILGIDGTDST